MLNGRMAAVNARLAAIIRSSSAGPAQIEIGWNR